jgi:N-dimethylarginine dimethylaminohydrolase
MIKLNIHNETAPLQAVVLGKADDRQKTPHANNPKIVEAIQLGTVPTEEGLSNDISTFERALLKYGVEVFRPHNIPEQDQIFSRDIGFVIGDTFVKANMKKENRRPEIKGITHLLEQMEKVVHPPADATVEGGDVIVHNKYLFVGLGDRTNQAGVDFLKAQFGHQWEVIAFDMTVTDNPMTNILHLDCAFQPVGEKYAIIYEDGFQKRPDIIYDLFGAENLIRVSGQEMYDMFPNIFSISPEVVVVDAAFTRLIGEFEKRGIQVEQVNYREVSKLGGLLRCSTLPLRRS